ncbi:MAG: aminopeptidase [Bacteroidales bacterium]|jgi:bleomycin hydrolase|nr:aminopeptidase [Bacteroidales bacterium]
MIKKVIFSLGCLMMGFAAFSQQNSNYEFTVIKEVKTTPVKDQSSSGTCWGYAGISFIESELLRKGKPEYDLSEMWIVRHTYPAKAEKYMRLHGKINMEAGGSFEDVFWVMRTFGIVPQEVYQGLNYGEDRNVHAELDAIAKAYVTAVLKTHDDAKAKNRAYTLTTAWLNGFNGFMDAYLGERPEKFTYQGKQYSPQSFMQSLDVDLDDYVSITSYTHHPFYQKFILEIPDNWIWGASYNLPMDEMLEVARYALNNGHSVLWGADVSEKGFAYRKGFAVVPETNAEEMSASDKAHWIGVSDKERESQIMKLDGIVPEKKITQEMRQQAFDNFLTTDDHGMHITGIAKDQNGNTFFKVKNSWGTSDSKYNGYFYVSEPYFSFKTMNYIVHKEAIPKHIAKKLNIQ